MAVYIRPMSGLHALAEAMQRTLVRGVEARIAPRAAWRAALR